MTLYVPKLQRKRQAGGVLLTTTTTTTRGTVPPIQSGIHTWCLNACVPPYKCHPNPHHCPKVNAWPQAYAITSQLTIDSKHTTRHVLTVRTAAAPTTPTPQPSHKHAAHSPSHVCMHASMPCPSLPRPQANVEYMLSCVCTVSLQLL